MNLRTGGVYYRNGNRDLTKDAEIQEQISENIALLVSSSESVNNRRQGLNTFFLTAHVGLLAAVGFTLKDYVPPSADWPEIRIGIITCLITWFASGLCRYWILILKSYQRVSKSKVQLMVDLEGYRGIRTFTNQYLICEGGIGDDKYEPLTDLEIKVAEHCRDFHHTILFLAILYVLFSATLLYVLPMFNHL